MAYTAKELKEMKDKMVSGGGYLSSKELDEKGTKIRIIPWPLDGRKEPVHFFNVGWEKKDDGKSSPVRFRVDEEIPEGINWATGEYQGKQTVNTPRTAVGFVAFSYRDKKIKVGEFTQSGIAGAIIDMMDETSASFCKDLSRKDIVLTKKKDGKYACTFSPDEAGPFSQDIVNALKSFKFSWEDYLSSEDPFENGQKYSDFSEVKEQKTSTNKNIEEDEKPLEEDKDFAYKHYQEELEEWRDKVTGGKNPKRLGDLSLEQLKAFKKQIEDAGKTAAPIYHYVAYATYHYELPPEDGLNDEDIFC